MQANWKDRQCISDILDVSDSQTCSSIKQINTERGFKYVFYRFHHLHVGDSNPVVKAWAKSCSVYSGGLPKVGLV